jgi:hypothetical protein
VRRGAAGSRRQGTWVQFDLRLGSGDRRVLVEAARFRAFGCPHVIAVCDWLAQTGVGLEPCAVLAGGVQALQRRFEVPVEKLGRLLIVEDAWNAALAPPW